MSAPQSVLRPAGSSRPRRLFRMARKEIRESLRDRRTLATLILMPILVYPLLGLVVQRFAFSRSTTKAPEAIVIVENTFDPREAVLMLAEPEPEPDVETILSGGPQKPSETEHKTAEQSMQQLAAQVAGNATVPGLKLEGRLFSADEIRFLIGTGSADVGILQVRPENPDDPQNSRPGTYVVVSRTGDPISQRAAEETEYRIQRFRDRIIRGLLSRTRVGSHVMPFVRSLSIQAIGPRESPLSAFVPLMLVLMTMTGAVYPAIDLTAGERERGTLEMLMAAPVARHDLLLGKFAAVFLVAVMTAVINLVAMLITLYATGFDRVLLADSVSAVTFVQVLMLLVVFASFFSAVLLSITSFARSFREAQAWLIPLMLVSLAPGILSLMPGVRLNLPLALVPLVNIVLLGKELFQGIASPLLFALTLLVTCGYAMAALRLAAGIFGSDAVLFSASSVSRRRPESEPTDVVPLSMVLRCGVLILPLLVILSGLRLRIVSQDNTAGQLLLSAIILSGLFAILPGWFLHRDRVRFQSAFAMQRFSLAAVPGAMLLGLSSWTMVYELLLFGQKTSEWTQFLNDPAMRQIIERLLRDAPLPLQILTLAAVPAVCEELFFRGFLMKGLLDRKRGLLGPLFVSTFVFAAAHVVTDSSLSLARFPGTFLLGLILGLIRLRTGSVFPGMAMHFINNALLLSLTRLEPVFRSLGMNLALENETHLPGALLATAGVCAVTGALLILSSRPGQGRQTTN